MKELKPVAHPELLKPARKSWDESSAESSEDCARDGAGLRELAASDPLVQIETNDVARPRGIMVKANLRNLWNWFTRK